MKKAMAIIAVAILGVYIGIGWWRGEQKTTTPSEFEIFCKKHIDVLSDGERLEAWGMEKIADEKVYAAKRVMEPNNPTTFWVDTEEMCNADVSLMKFETIESRWYRNTVHMILFWPFEMWQSYEYSCYVGDDVCFRIELSIEPKLTNRKEAEAALWELLKTI